MATFDQQINNFTSYGTFSYQFDSAGNLILNASSSVFQQVYLSMDLINFNYDQTKILSFYDPSFQEFVKPASTSSAQMSEEVQEYINNINQENQDLRQQLDEVINSVDQATKTISDEQGIKDIILQLRIALGQGKTEEDFFTTFPYLPLSTEGIANGTNTIEEMLPGAPQLLPEQPFVPSTVTTRVVQVTGSGITNVADTKAVTVAAVTSSGASISGLGKSIITVTNVQYAYTNFWTRGKYQYKLYDPVNKKWVYVVKDSTSNYYVDQSTGQYYALSSALNQKFKFGSNW